MKLMSSLAETTKRDMRNNFANFYITFDFANFYAKPMLNLVLNEKRKPKNVHFLSFVSRCINIYSEHTKDYRGKSKEIKPLLSEYNATHEIPISIERLQEFTGADLAAMRMAIRSTKDSKIVNDLYDVLTLDLYSEKRDINTIFNNVQAYRELDRRLMRAQIGDGTRIYTLYEIAEKTGLSLDTLEHLEKACHSFDEYAKTYEALVKIQMPYQF